MVTSTRTPPCFRHVLTDASFARPVAPAARALYSSVRSWIYRRAVEPGALSATWLRRGERFSMDDEARATGLGPAPDREPKDSSKGGSRRGRRSPYRHPRSDEFRNGPGAKPLG